MTSARVLRLLPRQLTMPVRLALAPPSRAAARGYFLMVLQQPNHRCWSASSSSCEQYPQAPIAAPPGATCPRERKGKRDGDGEAARDGEKAAGKQQDDSSGAGAPSPPAPKDKEALSAAAAAAGRKGRSGVPPSRQRGRTAKPQVNKPARPGDPKQGRGDGGGIIHAAPRSSSSASSTSPSASSTSSSTRLRATTKKQESEDRK